MVTTDALIILLGVLALVALVLGGIYVIKPGQFRVKATLTKWLSLDIEVTDPATCLGEQAGRPIAHPPNQPVTPSSEKAPRRSP